MTYTAICESLAKASSNRAYRSYRLSGNEVAVNAMYSGVFLRF